MAKQPKEKFSFLGKFGIGKPRSSDEPASTALARRKILFMHIAKAAGSTVNVFFANHYSETQYAIHLESNEKWQTNPDELKSLSFLSGHISLPVLGKKLNLEDYYKVTVIREPYAQLCSHLAWIKRLAMPGEEKRFKQHPEYIQVLARKLAATEFTALEKLKTLLGSLTEREAKLIENCQTRYFIFVPPGRSVDETDTRKAIEASATFDRIGITESISSFMKDVASDMSWPEPDDRIHQNVTQDFYGLDLSDCKTREVLRPLVQHDIELYKHIASIQNRH